MLFESRNNAIGFAGRTRKNLEYVRNAFDCGEDVHVVTQLVISLLGLVVLPWERNLVEHIQEVKLRELADQDWPEWSITLGCCETLGELVYHIRNAVAHGRVTFSSDSRNLAEVEIIVEDAKPGRKTPDWRAKIGGNELYSFCLRFAEYVDSTIG